MMNPGTTGDGVDEGINSVLLSVPAYYTNVMVLNSLARSRMSFCKVLCIRRRAKPCRKQMAKVGTLKCRFSEESMSLVGLTQAFEVRWGLGKATSGEI